MSRDGGRIVAVVTHLPQPKGTDYVPVTTFAVTSSNIKTAVNGDPVVRNRSAVKRFIGVRLGEWQELHGSKDGAWRDGEPNAVQIDGIVTVKLADEPPSEWRYHDRVYIKEVRSNPASEVADDTVFTLEPGDDPKNTPIGYLLDVVSGHARVQLDRSLQFSRS